MTRQKFLDTCEAKLAKVRKEIKEARGLQGAFYAYKSSKLAELEDFYVTAIKIVLDEDGMDEWEIENT